MTLLAASFVALAWAVSSIAVARALVLVNRDRLERTERLELRQLREQIDAVERQYVEAAKRATFGRR